MKNLLRKELKLSASPLTYLFVLFAFLTFCPGYPILVGGFFVCLGMFQSFRSARESNDLLYAALLPIKKSDVVQSKYIFCVFIEMCAFIISAIITLLRMTLFSNAPVYQSNALMNANFAYLGYLLLIFGLFNAIFICGFFKTGYFFTKPFVKYSVAAFLIIGIGEVLFHIPGWSAINSFGFDHIGLQLLFFGGGLFLYILLTVYSEKRAEKHFNQVDL